MKTKKENRKVANTGSYMDRVIKNTKNGWFYPSAVVIKSAPGGKWGNIYHYYFYDEYLNEFQYIYSLPTWAGTTMKSKYQREFQIEIYPFKNYKKYSIQEFVTIRK